MMTPEELRELDCRIAEEVFGINLVPSRVAAMVTVGRRYISSTGPTFILTTGEHLPMPAGNTLQTRPEYTHWNDRYAYYVAQHLGEAIAAEVDAVRLEPEAYSRDLLAAMKIVDAWKGTVRQLRYDLNYDGAPNGRWRVEFYVRHGPLHGWAFQRSLPLAIVLARLMAVDANRSDEAAGRDIPDVEHDAVDPRRI